MSPTRAPAARERWTTTVAIIGGGPGGYVAGIRCGQLGLDTVLIDDQPLGGTCLNVGCIPSKALIHAADEFARLAQSNGMSALGISAPGPSIDLATTVAWKDGIVERLNTGVASLLERVGTTVVNGRATLIDGKTLHVAAADGNEIEVHAEHVVIATGSTPIELPAVPFGGPVLSSTGALSLTEVPRSLAVVGGGYIGAELGMAYAKLGTHVTVVEAEASILPQYDRELVRPVVRRLDELDVSVLTSTLAAGVAPGELLVAGADDPPDDPDAHRKVPAEKVLVTVGRRPNLDGWGLDQLALSINGGAIEIDERGQTSMRHVWAIGDVTGEPMLAHRAMKQGEVVAEAIAGEPSVFDAQVIPAIVFTDPEIVVVGASPEEAEAAHGADGVVVGRFPLSANGRTMTLDESAGFVRVVARSDNHLVLGIQAVGAAVAELSTAFGLAIEMGARLEDIAGTIHAHPTVGEAFAEAALSALGHPLHI